ncbi:carbohydrate porin [Roseivirga sp. E12]|uniref:carbohydrate porin n=1 Tax=Roseivirga sp. E12 TaxID=2819237 RepID=UPI001ABD2044|nr:carbohydrate porin [Roseivirga sp. E12]MBO3700471.1 carbohydrate porin [Roseivirga sp. E12]
MRKNSFLVLLYLALFTLYSSNELTSQTLEYTNETAYLTEILSHTSKNGGKDVHFIGWFLNTSTLAIGEKHSLNLGLMMTHGGEPSANIVGDLQTFSNLEAGSLYGLYEMYYQYQADDFWIKFGQQDLNTDFLVSENALLFTHSSFGIDPVATINMPAPTYPVTSVALTTGINLSEKLKLKLGIFDGQFAIPRDNFLTVNWNIPRDEGLLYIIEPEFKMFNGRLIQKVGYFCHSGQFVDKETQNISRGLSAYYLVSDLLLAKKEEKTTNLFLQFNTSTKSVSDLNYYYGIGLRLTNHLRGKPNEIGLALGHAVLNDQFASVRNEYNLKSESIIEFNYKQEISDWLSLQPYFQWIGMNQITNNQKNPIIVALRAYIEF